MALTLGKITVGGELLLRTDDGEEHYLGRYEVEVELTSNHLVLAPGLPPLNTAIAPEPEPRPLHVYDLVTVSEQAADCWGMHGRIEEMPNPGTAVVRLDDRAGSRRTFHVDALVRRDTRRQAVLALQSRVRLLHASPERTGVVTTQHGPRITWGVSWDDGGESAHTADQLEVLE